MASVLAERPTKAEMPAPDATPRRTRISKPLLAILTLLSIPTAIFLHGCLYYTTPVSPSWNDDLWWLDSSGPIEPFEPLKRYSLSYGGVACWQNNGVWIKYLSPVEMSYLGVDRFKDSDRALEQADEDAFCTRLRMHGASFWELPPRWPENVNWCEDIDACVPPTKEVGFAACYPASGGVWVLDTRHCWEGLPRKTAGLRNALTMDERCEVIKNSGGRFCQDILLCLSQAL
jgi:hypothetical protein